MILPWISQLLSIKDTLEGFRRFWRFWSNVFWYVKVWIFWKCIQYTVHWSKTQLSKKKNLLDKTNGRENALSFIPRAPNHPCFSFNLRFVYELKLKVCLTKTVCRTFHFRFRFAFFKIYIFVQQSTAILWL